MKKKKYQEIENQNNSIIKQDLEEEQKWNYFSNDDVTNDKAME